MQIGATYNHLPAILASDAFHQSGCRSYDIGLVQSEALDPLGEPFAEQQGLVLAAVPVLMAVGELDELAKWGIAITTPRLDLCSIEFVIAVARGGIDTKMLRIEGLDEEASRFQPTPGPARHLG